MYSAKTASRQNVETYEQQYDLQKKTSHVFFNKNTAFTRNGLSESH